MSELIPYARNARTHSDAQVAQLAQSINNFGWTNPILIDEKGGIIAGHGRVMAAQKLNFETVPCIVVSGLDETAKRNLILADNKIALNAGWDFEMLRSELADLKLSSLDLSMTGFSESELSNLLMGANDARSEWNGMPAFTQEDKMAYRTIKVHFKDQAAVEAFAKLISAKISHETRYLWFPENEIAVAIDKRIDG